MYNKTQVKPLGKIKTEVYNPKNKKHYELEFLVTDQTANPLLGSIAIQKMDLITVNQENIYVCEELLTKESMLRNYKMCLRVKATGGELAPRNRQECNTCKVTC